MLFLEEYEFEVTLLSVKFSCSNFSFIKIHSIGKMQMNLDNIAILRNSFQVSIHEI